jgi:hypothetical protein
MPQAPVRPRGPAAFHFGPGHMIMHGNPPFIAEFGRASVGLPAREALLGLPQEAFEVMDLVFWSGRSLARTIVIGGDRRRLIVVPRRDPETGETYGVTTYLRAPAADTPGV